MKKQLLKVSAIGIVLMISFLNLNIGFNSGSTNFDLSDVKIINNANATEGGTATCNSTTDCNTNYTTKTTSSGSVFCCGKYDSRATGHKQNW